MNDSAHIALAALGYSVVEKKPQSIRLLKKRDEEQHLVYGIVMEPGVADTYGDIASAVEIEKAMHSYAEKSRSIDVLHNLKKAACFPVEMYIAPVDFTVGKETIKKGSWVQVTKINDNTVWDEGVKTGILAGYSIYGTGYRDAA